MRKILLALSLLLTLPLTAQKKDSVLFDFNSPTSLIPAQEHPVLPGGEIVFPITTVFTDIRGFVNLTFEKGAGIVTPRLKNDDFGENCFLYLSRTMGFVLSGQNITITGVQLFGSLGDLRPSMDQPGSYITPNWSDNEAGNITTVAFHNGGYAAEVEKIKVYIDCPVDILHPVLVNPEQGTTLTCSSTTTFTLTFDHALSRIDDTVICELVPLDDQNTSSSIILNKSLNGNVLTLSCNTEDLTAGNYVLVIPQGVVYDSDGYCNTAQSYSYTLQPDYATFNIIAINPDPSEVVHEIPNGFTITFPDAVKFWDTSNLKIKDQQGETARQVKAERDAEHNEILIFNFQDDPTKPIKTKGIYTLVIPERFAWNSVYNSSANDLGLSVGARYNAETEIRFNVLGVKEVSSEVLQRANSLLAYTGVGYPNANDSTRTKLSNMLDEKEDYNDEDFNAAIDEYLRSDNVLLPEEGKFYTIASKNNVGDSLYLYYDKDAGRISLTNQADEAAKFEAIEISDGLGFRVAGQYLTNPINFDLTTGTLATNLTDELDSEMNKLQLAHLSIDTISAESLFGLLYIYGFIGQNADGEPYSAYALINYSNNSFATSAMNTRLYFGLDRSSGFIFKETTAPVEDVAYTLSPSSESEVYSLSSITLEFPTLQEVSLQDINQIVLEGSNSYSSLSVTPDENNQNIFVLNFPDDMEEGSYTLLIGQGAFTYTLNGVNVPVQTITANYRLMGTQFNVDLGEFVSEVIHGENHYYYRLYQLEGYGPWDAVDPEELQHLTFFNYDGEFGIADKEVKLVERDHDDRVKIRGHFERVPNFRDANHEKAYAVRLVVDNTPDYESFEDGYIYEYVIPEATLGDTNYAKWLADNSSISKDQCHVNKEIRLLVLVSKLLTGIADVDQNHKKQSKDIFDLQGRRVEGKAKPGMYIVNGRKVIIK